MATALLFLIQIVKIIIGLTALSVLLSFTVAWYERANSSPALIERRFTPRGIGVSIWLLTQETACLLLTIALRPLGWFPAKIPDSHNTSCPPVILLHGLFENRCCMLWLQSHLRKAGFHQTISINTPPWRDFEALTEDLVKKVDELCIKLKVNKFIIIGHSMGGMIGRNYVQNRGGAEHTLGLITLGSPHHGSKLAPFAITSMGKSLLPGSDFLRKLNQEKWPENVKAISVYTRYDNIVLPVESAKMEGSKHIELNGMGHIGLLFHPLSMQTVVEAANEISQ